jgi:regulator of protease activity HflC (stomatin/prohibitin superfamily)
VDIQSEAAVRHLASSYAYDTIEDEHASITLRDGSGKINEMLEKELNERIAQAGVEVIEARISHLSYAPEIAHAMLQRQQATAVVAARKQIVEGAVGMVEMALARLSEKEIVHLDEERKAAMVSNLLVVLCGDKSVNPVVNAGTLYN